MEFLLNDRPVAMPACSPQTTLLDFLRSQGLTGSKEGCAEGECGACTVLLLRNHAHRTRFVAVNSCLLFLPMLAGQTVYTVEALAAAGKLSAVQQAMAEGGGSQCGYCTPGFVVSLFAEQHRPARIGPCDPHAMGGNLCRCTGYRPIRDAALSLGAPEESPLAAQLNHPAPPINAFSFEGEDAKTFRPGSLGDCFRLLKTNPGARLIAGGTDLAVESNLLFKRFPSLISTEALPELRGFAESEREVEIGAGLALSEVQELWQSAPPVVREWFSLFASPLIRNRATLGGNIATASPIGDAPPLLLALDAELKLASALGQRRISLSDFFTGYRKTQLATGEIIQSVIVPKPYPDAARFFKVAKRRMDDISTIAACFALRFEGTGKIRQARLAYGGVAATPIRLRDAEQLLIGRRWDEQASAEAQALAAALLQPLSDHRGSAAYRLAVAQSLIEKFRVSIESGVTA